MRMRSRRLLGAAVLGVLVLSIAAYGGQSLTRVWHLMREVEGLEREVGVLRVEASRLTAEVDRLRTDPDYMEQLAREKLGFVKPGEQVYKLPPSTSGPAPAPAAPSPGIGDR